MPRNYWTRNLELELVELVRQKECVWMPVGNTNHHIEQKYKAYAEFAAQLGHGFTARSVRDRWVNIRSTFNHNLRRVNKSKETATRPEDIYVPCWPLWKPLQFLRLDSSNPEEYDGYSTLDGYKHLLMNGVKDEPPSDFEEPNLSLRQRGQRTNRPRRKNKLKIKCKSTKCNRIIEDLVYAIKPFTEESTSEINGQNYWFFGKHVTERLNCMREIDAESATREIMKIINKPQTSDWT